MKKFLVSISLLLFLLGLTACGTAQVASTSTSSPSISSLEDRITNLEAKVSALENQVIGTASSGINQGLINRVGALENILGHH
jgi:peptidoglycan hydrolase CwlO-like protein